MRSVIFLLIIPLITIAQPNSNRLGIEAKGGLKINGDVIAGFALIYDLQLNKKISWASGIGNYFHGEILTDYLLIISSGAKLLLGDLKPDGTFYTKLQFLIVPYRNSNILYWGYGIGLTIGYTLEIEKTLLYFGLNGELINKTNLSNLGIVVGYGFTL
ncbi:MAG: hypothetical protein QY331_09085 [Melioribacteraceae bacterium]|nr:MAG: hypothetical protein QY331_09085 [Melioribacteraceae bacterium]